MLYKFKIKVKNYMEINGYMPDKTLIGHDTREKLKEELDKFYEN